MKAFKVGEDDDEKPESYHSGTSSDTEVQDHQQKLSRKLKVVDRMVEDQKRRQESKERNEKLRV